MNDLVVLAVAGVGTWALRASAVVLAGGRTLPEPLVRALTYARHAVLAALIAGAVPVSTGQAAAWVSPELIATVVAGVVCWFTRSVPATLVAGMGAAALAGAL